MTLLLEEYVPMLSFSINTNPKLDRKALPTLISPLKASLSSDNIQNRLKTIKNIELEKGLPLIVKK